MTYFPILKAKQGELKALEQWEDERRPDVFPVLEVTPWERLEDAYGADLVEQDAPELDAVAKRISRAWSGKAQACYIDAAYAEPDLPDGYDWADTEPVLNRILGRLVSEDLNVLPVVRASANPVYVRWIGETISRQTLHGALIRVTAEDLDDSVIPLRQLVLRTAAALQLTHDRITLLLDFGAVEDEGEMAMAARLARFVLPQLAEDEWRRLVVASGAFPVNLAEVQSFELSRVARWDVRLWESLQQFKLPNGHRLHYSDYAVTHPALPVGAGFAAPPQLRYTQRSDWVVAKGKRQDRRGHAQFYDICGTILAQLGSAASPAESSWGDNYIHMAAEASTGAPASVGTGNASTWRAVATSHHLAYTADQLREWGVL